MSDDIKQCPYCAEDIKAAAIVCKHCGRDIGKLTSSVETAAASPGPKKAGPIGKLIVGGSIIAAGVLLLCSIISLIGGDGDTSSRSRDTPPTSSTVGVTYRVTTSGNTTIDLTFENDQGNTEQVADRRIQNSTPWTKRGVFGRGEFVYVSAQQGDSNGTVTCEILVAGVVVESATSSGPYTIATCSGRAEQ